MATRSHETLSSFVIHFLSRYVYMLKWLNIQSNRYPDIPLTAQQLNDLRVHYIKHLLMDMDGRISGMDVDELKDFIEITFNLIIKPAEYRILDTYLLRSITRRTRKRGSYNSSVPLLSPIRKKKRNQVISSMEESSSN